MGTVTVRMPDEEIEKLEKIAEKEGKTKSSLLREITEKEIKRGSPEALKSIAGAWSEERAEEVRRGIKEMRKKEGKLFKKSTEEKWD